MKSARPLRLAALSALALLLPEAPALALKPIRLGPAGPGPSLEAAAGAKLRPTPSIAWETPPAARPAWQRFLGANGQGWRALFDARTAVPMRVLGPGIPAPGAVAAADVAERIARETLARHLDLLAPGAALADFVVTTNHLSSGMRTVVFTQRSGGLPVLGGRVSFSFKRDRLFVIGSHALPGTRVAAPAILVTPATAQRAATAWMTADLAKTARVTAGPVAAAAVLPLVRTSGAIDARVVLPVRVDSSRPRGAWEVYVDAATGARVARRPLLFFAEGTLRYDAPVRHPLGERRDWPATRASVLVDGTAAETSTSGQLDWLGDAAATIVAYAGGPLAEITNSAGANAIANLTLAHGGTAVWSLRDSEFGDAQISAYVHTLHANAWARTLGGGDVAWLDAKVPVTVNIGDVCNAYSDGDTINFYRGDATCANAARVADVVYHEYGHSFHYQAALLGAANTNDAGFSALSEGVADYTAATITGDPRIGLGFNLTDLAEPIRAIDEPDATWPEDTSDDPHVTGLIFGGAMWDLRQLLAASYGDSEGVAMADALLYRTMQHASNIPETYVELLAADDDDGNLANGTPNQCLIDDAFARHGLASSLSGVMGLSLPERDGWSIILRTADGGVCPAANVTGGTLEWRLRSSPTTGGTITLAPETGSWAATIPTQSLDEVVEYRVTITLADGSAALFPDNQADPWYQLFAGEPVPIYCTDFESAESPPGWSHGRTAGAATVDADDWQWGAPKASTGAGDPRLAHSGTNVYGNDLGGGWDGAYRPATTTFLRSPSITVRGFPNARLQYWRWLTVQDGAHDQARILAGDQEVWTNLTTAEGTTDHLDREWRFHDVDLTEAAAAGDLQVTFELASDEQLQRGGWTIDDFCVVGYVPTTCGDGRVQDGEGCDDGNRESGDGCQATCVLPVCGDTVVDPGEECDDGNQTDDDGCSSGCQLPPGTCGNGQLEHDEACDDGNRDDDDACTRACALPSDDGGCGCVVGARTAGGRGRAAGIVAALALLAVLGVRGRPRRRPTRG